jgi:hypothetical protein
MSSDKKVQKMKLIKKLKIGRGVDSGSSSSDKSDIEDEDLDKISLNTVKDLYENSGDGIEGSATRSKRRRKNEDNEEMNLSEIEKNLEDGVDQMLFLDVDLKNSTDKILVFRKTPFT